MLFFILSALYLFFSILIIKYKGQKRLLYFLLAVFVVPGNMKIIPNSLFTGFMLYSSSFLISLYYHKELRLRNFTRCPIYYSLIAMAISCFFIAILDEYQGPLNGLWEGLKYYLRTYFLFFVGWFSFSNLKEQQNIFSKQDYVFSSLLPFTLIVTIYGLATFFTRTNPILEVVGLEDHFLFEGHESFRSFRVTGCNISPEVYGLTCGIFFLCGMFWIKNKSIIQISAIILLLINLFLAGSRAAMIVIILSLSIYLITFKGLIKTIKYYIIGIAAFILITPVLPDSMNNLLLEIQGSITSVITPTEAGDEKYTGSSVEGREMQILTAMEYLKEKPFFGHGFGYGNKVLLKDGAHEGLLGMESYLCYIGVEFGIFYAIAIIILFINCLVYFYKNRKYAPVYAYMGISFVLIYIIFLIGAWVGNAWYTVMPILGYITRTIYVRKRYALTQALYK